MNCCDKLRKQCKHEAINAMIAVIDGLDEYTCKHSKNTANYALLLAEELKLAAHDIEIIYYAALFHDIGKIGISPAILQKESALTPEEYEIIKEHPVKGAKILENFSEFIELLPIVKHHHEMFAGAGYPEGLVGDAIPFGARLIAVVDAYDAITTNRAYRKAQELRSAIDLIVQKTPEQFDPEIVEAFVRIEKNL
jgi:putative nucleotidyltransferase with HDIG domain